jgi:CheY-like chemotaxis protein
MTPNKRILIIDDEDDIREIAKLSIELVRQWEVITASSGQEGLHTAAVEHPDAILLDVMMPDMDGLMTYQRLQETTETRNIPVVLLTAKIQETDYRRFLDLGVHGVLAKPFDPLKLADQLTKTLGWSV